MDNVHWNAVYYFVVNISNRRCIDFTRFFLGILCKLLDLPNCWHIMVHRFVFASRKIISRFQTKRLVTTIGIHNRRRYAVLNMIYGFRNFSYLTYRINCSTAYETLEMRCKLQILKLSYRTFVTAPFHMNFHIWIPNLFDSAF